MKHLIWTVLLFSVGALAQNLRYDNIALGPRGPIPGASIAVCTQPANTSVAPCSPLASLCSSLTDVTCTSPNPVTADSLGNYHFYMNPANSPFTVQIYGPQVATPFAITDQFATAQFSSNNNWTGTNTFTDAHTKILNNVQYADQYPNAATDIGQAINAAYAALPSTGGRIVVSAGSWPIVTPIACGVASKPCIIQGDPAGMTTLTYAATTGTAITLNWGAAHQYGGGMRDITLTGPCTTTACLSISAVGVAITSEGAYFSNVSIGKIGAGFFDGVSYNTVGFLNTWVNMSIYGNATGILQAGNTENLHFYGGSISANATAVDITGNGDLFFDKISFDDNTSTGGHILVNSANGPTIGFTDCHWENPSLGNAYYIQINAPANVYLRGGNLNDDRASGSQLYFISGSSAMNYLSVDGTNVYSAGITIPQIVNATTTGQGIYMRVMNNFPTRVQADVISSYVGGLVDLSLSTTNKSITNSGSHIMTEGTPAGAAAGFDVCQGSSTAHALQCSFNNDPFQNVSRGLNAYTTTTYTNATTTASNIPGLSFAVAANTNYIMQCTLYYQGSANSAGLDVTLTGPASPTSVTWGYIEEATSTGGTQDSVATAFGSKLTGAGTITATTNLPSTVTMGLRNGANSGTVQVQGSATGAGTVTVQPGSFCTLRQN